MSFLFVSITRETFYAPFSKSAFHSLLGLDIETILDSSLLAGNFFPVLGGFEKIFEEVLIPPGLEILSGEGIPGI